MPEHRRGVVLGALAYFAWGVFPLFWPLLRAASALEILAHRITWSLLVCGVLLGRRGELATLRSLGGRQVRLLALASALVATNWGIYIWAVNHRHVVETALGYFINPLVVVMLGVVVLKERLRRTQWIAIALAAVAVVVLTIDYGHPPWIALALAFSFGLYGFVKKRAGVPAVPALAIETGLLLLPAAGYLAFLEARGVGAFGHVSPWTKVLFVSSGVITAIPLLCFAGAANRVPLSTLGLLQYIAPTLQFLCGVVVFHEAMPAPRWAGFVLVWIALAVFVVDATVAASTRQRKLAV